MIPFRLCGALIIAAILAASGCKDQSAKADAAAGVAPAAAADASLAQAALPKLGWAPTWRLKNLAGKDVSLGDFRGKVVLLDFWATWCVPCRSEMPEYLALQKKYADRGFVIVGISLDGQGAGVVKKFVDGLGIAYPIVMTDGKAEEAYGVQVMPTTFLIDRDGQIRHKKVGAIQDAAEYEKIIASLL